MAVLANAFKTELYDLLQGESSLDAVQAFRLGVADASDEYPFLSVPELPFDRIDTWTANVMEMELQFDIRTKQPNSTLADSLGQALVNLLHGTPMTVAADSGSWKVVRFEHLKTRTWDEPASSPDVRIWTCSNFFDVRLEKI